MRSGQGRVLKGLLIMFSLQRIMTFLCGCSQLYKAEAAQSCRSFLFIAWREVGMVVGLTGPEGYKDSRIYPPATSCQRASSILGGSVSRKPINKYLKKQQVKGLIINTYSAPQQKACSSNWKAHNQITKKQRGKSFERPLKVVSFFACARLHPPPPTSPSCHCCWAPIIYLFRLLIVVSMGKVVAAQIQTNKGRLRVSTPLLPHLLA